MDKTFEKVLDEIVNGQKDALEAVKKLCTNRNFAYTIGVVSVFEAQSKALTEHMKANVDPIKTEVFLALSREIYNDNVETILITAKKES